MTIVRFLLRVLPSHLIAACRICAGAAPSALIVTVGLLFGPAAAQGQGGDVSPAAQRKSVTALTLAELMSLRRGVAVMMARNNASRGSNDFRRSWVYWANMHQHFGNDCGGAISGQGMAGGERCAASES